VIDHWLEQSPLVIALAILVAIVSVGRLTRLLTADVYPPSAWVRNQWRRLTHDGPWSDLVTCPFCAAPYIAAVILGWGLLSGGHWTWWVFNGWLALAYLASMLVVRDTPE